MLKRQAGLRALPFVSYEALFAISMAIDDSLLPQPPESTATCCKLRSSVCQQACQQSSETDARTLEAALRYFAAFSVLLAETKLKDDVSDSRSPLAWLGLRVLRKQRRDAAKELRQIDETIFDQLEQCFAAQAVLESRTLRVDLVQSVKPTGDAFAAVFGLLPKLIAQQQQQPVVHQQIERYQNAGRLVGQALIAFDCAVDFEADRRRGHYNPIADHEGLAPAFEFAIQQLVGLGFLLGGKTGSGSQQSVSLNIVGDRIQRIRQRLDAMVGKQPRNLCTAKPRRRPLLLPLRMQQGDCDCLCAGCDGCCTGCESCGSEAACEGCGASMLCCTCGNDCCFWVDGPSQRKRSVNYHNLNPPTSRETASQQSGAGQSTAHPDGTEIIGQRVQVRVPLQPFGTVVFPDGQEVAAKTAGAVIERDQWVVVIRQETFGLLVSPAEPKASEADPIS